MQVMLLRHGETIENKHHIIQGQLHSKLSEEGKDQARQIGKALSEECFDRIYCSDLRRSRQTAAYVRQHHSDTPIAYTELLREFHCGIYQGVPKTKIDWGSIKSSALHKPIPQGESWNDVECRVDTFLRDLRHHDDRHVLVVTHDGPIRVMQMRFENIPLTQTASTLNCGILRYTLGEVMLG